MFSLLSLICLLFVIWFKLVCIGEFYHPYFRTYLSSRKILLLYPQTTVDALVPTNMIWLSYRKITSEFVFSNGGNIILLFKHYYLFTNGWAQPLRTRIDRLSVDLSEDQPRFAGVKQGQRFSEFLLVFPPSFYCLLLLVCFSE